MDLTFNERELAFRDELRAWFAAHAPAPSPTATRTPTTTGAATFSGGWPTAAGRRCTGRCEYGGRGATLTQSAIFFEELGRSGAPLPANVLGLLLAGPTIMTWGTAGAEGALPDTRS